MRVLAVLALTLSAAAAAGVRQHGCEVDGGAATASVSLNAPQSVMTQNTLVVFHQRDEPTPHGVTISDTLGTSFRKVSELTFLTQAVTAWVGVAPAGGPDQITVAVDDGGTGAAIFFYELEGVDPTEIGFIEDGGIDGGDDGGLMFVQVGTLALSRPAVVISHALSNGGVTAVGSPLTLQDTCWGNGSADGVVDAGSVAVVYEVSQGKSWLSQALAFGAPVDGGTGGGSGGGTGGGGSTGGGSGGGAGGDGGVPIDGGTNEPVNYYRIGCSAAGGSQLFPLALAWLLWRRSRSRWRQAARSGVRSS